ncbi:MAG: GAF domain-containing protein [Chloroflexi bacterium]|nr:GAF domain-containing protein [Chloroflexota bacterium]
MSQSTRKSNWFKNILSKPAQSTSTRAHPFWSVSRKLVLPIISVLVVMALGLTLYNFFETTRRNKEEEAKDLARIESSVRNQVEGLQKLALAIATETANNSEVQSAFASGDRELLKEIMLPTFYAVQSEFDVKQYQFLLPPATSFLRLHQLDKFGDDLTSIRATVVQANTDKKAVSGPEIGRGGFGVRGVVPVNYQGKHIGVIDVGIDIGPSFLESIKQQYGMDAQIMLDNKTAQNATFQGAVTELAGPNEDLLFQAGTNDHPIYADISAYPRVMAGESVISERKIEGRSYSIISFPLKDFSGKVIGVLEIVSDRTEVIAAENRNLLLTILASLAAIIFGGFVIVQFINNTVHPIGELTETAIAVTGGNLERKAVVKSSDEIGTLANAFNSMVTQLRESLTTLEGRVAERTRNLELAAEVARSVSQVRAVDVMLKDAAELIRSRFDLYYVQVYLTNPSQTALVLQSGTGTVGMELADRGHQLPLNTGSINGRAAMEKRSVVISDTTASTTFRPNPLLPDTRSEMAVPLLFGENVVGVLDMQARQAGMLNQDMLTAFEALAGQLAIAIQNSNFLAETERARAEVEEQARRLSRANWKDYLDAIHRPEETGFAFEQNKIIPMTELGQSQLPINDHALTASIAVTGESLGNLVVEMEGQSPISRADELVNIVAQQVAQQIENLRLLDSAERYRFEAEEASRRLTREGWKDYLDVNADRGSSYIYDLKEVRQYDQAEGEQTEDAGYSLPLKIRDEAVGKLVVQGLGSDDKESLELASAVAERLSAHIESLRQFDETKRSQVELDKRARQLAAVAEVSSVSSRELDIDKMLHTVVHLTQRQFGLYHAHVFIYNENTAELKIAACGYKEGDEHEGTDGTAVIPLAQEKSLVARAARTSQAVIVNDVRNEAGWLPNPLLPETNSEMAVPLVIGDQILGVLDVQSEVLNAFTEEDANIYATLAAQVSTALQNARSFARTQQQAQRESTLNIISQKIQSATTVEAVLQIAARELGHALGAPMTIAQLSMKDRN